MYTSHEQDLDLHDETYPSSIEDTSTSPSHDLFHENNISASAEESLPAPSDFSAFFEQPLFAFPPVDNTIDTNSDAASYSDIAPIEASSSLGGVPSETMSRCDPISDDTLLALTEPFLMAWCLPKCQAPHPADLTFSSWDDAPSASPFWGDLPIANVDDDSPIDRSSNYPVDFFSEITQEFL